MVIPDVLELREVRLREHLGLGVFGLEAPLFGGCQFRLRVGVLTTRTLVEPLRLALRALLRRRPQAAREVLHADVERAVGEEARKRVGEGKSGSVGGRRGVSRGIK